MNHIIYSINHLTFIIFVVTHTLAIQTKYFYTQLSSSFDSSDRYHYHFGKNNRRSEDNLIAYACSQIQNNSPKVNKGILGEGSDTLTPADLVREQYALLPYPAVTHEEINELRRHYEGINHHVPYIIPPHNELDVVNHFLYKGKNNFMIEFRIMVPGGGTQGGVFMSEQLNHTKNSEIVYIDFSKSSMSIAQLKIKIRKTSNVVWVRSWIEDIPLSGLGIFDYITCTGVLHHLKDPQSGLRLIRDVQPQQYGGGSIMVYGKYGRSGIYQIQHLMRITNEKETTMRAEISNAKKILDILPDNHWVAHKNLYDAQMDIGIYDLFLHKRDVAYSIKDLYEWTEKSAYHIISFSFAGLRSKLSPGLRLDEKSLYQSIIKKKLFKQHWITELMCSDIRKQEIYVSTRKDAKASMKSSDHLVYCLGSPLGFPNIIEDLRNFRKLRDETFVFSTLKYSAAHDNESSFTYNKPILRPSTTITTFAFPLTEFGSFLIIELTKRPNKPMQMAQIMDTFKSKMQSNISSDIILKEFEYIFPYLENTGVFLIKHKSLGIFPKTCCMNRFRVWSIGR